VIDLEINLGRRRPLEFVPREPPFGAGSDPSNITDACYPYGSIQVPGGTEPIVLHRDAVSGGGYFMVGTVISADINLIGQLQPNTPDRRVIMRRRRFVRCRHRCERSPFPQVRFLAGLRRATGRDDVRSRGKIGSRRRRATVQSRLWGEGLFVFPLLLLYTAISYGVFRGKVRATDNR
jgi:hypothetical protein